MPDNQTPEQAARERIDQQLRASGWEVQSLAELDPSAARGVAVREYSTDTGPMDYLLMVDSEPLGLIEAKREEEGHCMSKVEEQSARYAGAELKHVGRADLRFVYEATGTITRFTDRQGPGPSGPRTVPVSSPGDPGEVEFPGRPVSGAAANSAGTAE